MVVTLALQLRDALRGSVRVELELGKKEKLPDNVADVVSESDELRLSLAKRLSDALQLDDCVGVGGGVNVIVPEALLLADTSFETVTETDSEALDDKENDALTLCDTVIVPLALQLLDVLR